jgi:putative MATE family efflux protein
MEGQINPLLNKLIAGEKMPLGRQLELAVQLSIPAMLAQISSIVMQYIDASMVGKLGSDASAAIGLVSTTTWLFGGLCVAVTTGFTVQVAHSIGSGENKTARNIVKQGLLVALAISLVLMVVALLISGILPTLLGGAENIREMASDYFRFYMMGLCFMQLNSMAGGMLQSSGNMKTPGILNIMCCALDVVLNMFFIFPSRSVNIGGLSIFIPGLNLSVRGAAIGTVSAEIITSLLMLWFLLFKSESLRLRREESLHFERENLKKALKIGLPVGFEQLVTCSAYVMSTKIVSPLGNIAIAANSFAVTAESFCYMPGYGVQSAATTLVGQCVGAGRKKTAKQMAWICTGLGVAIMSAMAVLMYVAAPWMIGFLTPDEEIRTLGVAVLRIEAFAEPLYAASIVASGALRGAGDTLVPSCVNFASMWLVRIPLAACLAPVMGLSGVWTAMCIELCVRGILLLIRLKRTRF